MIILIVDHYLQRARGCYAKNVKLNGSFSDLSQISSQISQASEHMLECCCRENIKNIYVLQLNYFSSVK